MMDRSLWLSARPWPQERISVDALFAFGILSATGSYQPQITINQVFVQLFKILGKSVKTYLLTTQE